MNSRFNDRHHACDMRDKRLWGTRRCSSVVRVFDPQAFFSLHWPPGPDRSQIRRSSFAHPKLPYLLSPSKAFTEPTGQRAGTNCGSEAYR